MSNFYIPSLPVSHPSSHGGHTESGIVWVIQLPAEEKSLCELSGIFFSKSAPYSVSINFKILKIRLKTSFLLVNKFLLWGYLDCFLFLLLLLFYDFSIVFFACLKSPHSLHSHVSLHHFSGVFCSIVEVLQVSLHFTHCAPHPQQVNVCLSQNRFCLLNAFPADFYYLKNKTKQQMCWYFYKR